MSSNADSIVAQIQQDMLSLLTYATGPQTATQTAYTVELTLFRRLLALGAALLRLFFLARAASRRADRGRRYRADLSRSAPDHLCLGLRQAPFPAPLVLRTRPAGLLSAGC